MRNVPLATLFSVHMVICVICATIPVRAAHDYTLLVNGRIGAELNVDSREFFQEYQRTTQMPINSFDAPFFVAGSLKFSSTDWQEEWCVGISAEYWSTHIGDTGPMTISSTSGDIRRQLLENLHLSALPLIACVEYSPFHQQFRSYVGAGLGAALVTTEWSEISEPLLSGDTRRGGSYINSNELRPLVKLYCGVFLGFDQFNVGSNGGIFLEAGYTFCRNSVHPWTQLQSDEKFLQGITDKANNLGISSLSLALGVQFRFRNSRP